MEWVVWILQGLLGCMFLMAGVTKLAGQQMHLDNFAKWGYPSWFRLFTGAIEGVIAIGLITGYFVDGLTVVAATALVIVAAGGVITHIRAKDTTKESMPIAVLGLLALALALLG